MGVCFIEGERNFPTQVLIGIGWMSLVVEARFSLDFSASVYIMCKAEVLGV